MAYWERGILHSDCLGSDDCAVFLPQHSSAVIHLLEGGDQTASSSCIGLTVIVFRFCFG